MNQQEAMQYLTANNRGVLATSRRDGRPQLSPIDFGVDSDGQIKIQVTEPAAKSRNIAGDPRVSLSVIGDDWGQYIVVEGTARLVMEDRAANLRHVYQLIGGKPHPDWDEFNQAMLDEQQVVMAIEIERLYPVSG